MTRIDRYVLFLYIRVLAYLLHVLDWTDHRGAGVQQLG